MNTLTNYVNHSERRLFAFPMMNSNIGNICLTSQCAVTMALFAVWVGTKALTAEL